MGEVPLDQPVRRADVLWRRVGERILIRRLDDPDLVVLADTAVDLWDALAEAATVTAIVDALATAHGASVDAITADVQLAVTSLIDEQLVVPA